MGTSFRSPRRRALVVACIALAVLLLLALSAARSTAAAGALPLEGASPPGSAAHEAGTAPPILDEWGTSGTGNGQFDQPIGIAVGPSGQVFVTDKGNHRVQEFTSSGDFVTKWGGYGSGNGQFVGPWGIAVAPSSGVYVVDGGNARIQAFGPDHVFTRAWGSLGAGSGQLDHPRGMAIDSVTGRIYVADYGNNRVQVSTVNGTWLATWGSEGTEKGQFRSITDVALSSDSEYILALDAMNARVTAFRQDGTVAREWGSLGTGKGQFNNPVAIAVDSQGRVYVCDHGNSRIQVFNSDWTYLAQWSVAGSELTDIAADAQGNVYVVDNRDDFVRKYGPLTGGSDKTPPVTKVQGVDDKWHKTPVTLVFTAKDDAGGEVQRTEIRSRRDDLLSLWSEWERVVPDRYGDLMYTLPPGYDPVDGEWLVEFRSVDSAGNRETPQQVTVRIDLTAPRTTVLPLEPATVKRGAKVVVRMKVVEQLSEKVRFRLGFYDDDADTIVLVKKSAWVKVQRTRPNTYSFACRLAPGAYHVVVEATDLAGNTSEPDSAPLVVK